MKIQEVNDQVTFLYHHMVGGVNDQDKLYAIVLKVDNEQMELLVDQKDYEVINEDLVVTMMEPYIIIIYIIREDFSLFFSKGVFI